MRKINNSKLSFSVFLAFFIPIISSAQTIQTLASEFRSVIDLARPIVLSLALVFFIWGVGTFILNAGDSKLREEGKQRMIWGIIAMFVILSIWGIVAFLSNTFAVPTCDNLSTCFSPN